MHQKHLWRSVFFVKTSGKSSWILLKITLHKKCFWAFFSYINGNTNIGKESKWCLYTEVGLRWPAHQIDVNLRRLPNFIKTYHEKMVPKQREKRGEAGRFYMQLYIWCVLRFEIISLITKLMVSNCKTHQMLSFLSVFFFFFFFWTSNQKVIILWFSRCLIYIIIFSY